VTAAAKKRRYTRLNPARRQPNDHLQAAALTAAALLAWLRLLALDGPLARAEPKTLRYRILHAAAKLTCGGRQRRLNIAATWPWAAGILTASERISALPQAS
jgi:Transposase DDE domain group 1